MLAIVVVAGLALGAALPAAGQQPGERLRGENLRDATLQDNIVTDSRIRDSQITNSRIDGSSILTSNLERSAVSDTGLRNVRARLSAFNGVDVNTADLQGIVATNANFRNAEIRDFSLRGSSVNGGSLINGVIRDVGLRGGVTLCNVLDLRTDRFITSGCAQLDEPVERRGVIRDTARDLQDTLRGALELAQRGTLRLPEIEERGFFVEVTPEETQEDLGAGAGARERGALPEEEPVNVDGAAIEEEGIPLREPAEPRGVAEERLRDETLSERGRGETLPESEGGAIVVEEEFLQGTPGLNVEDARLGGENLGLGELPI